MTEEQKAAYIQAETTGALIKALGMLSENLNRIQRNEAIAYNENAFLELIDTDLPQHNRMMCLFHDALSWT